MQAPFDNIVQHLFHQPSLLSVTVNELERMAEQHPYFAAAHFLLLKKMQDTDHPQFVEQLYKTSLYFNNPLWLQYLLKPATAGNFKVADQPPFVSNEPVIDNDSATETVSEPEPAIAEQETIEQPDLNAVPALIEDHIAEPSNGHSTHASMPENNGGIMEVITEVFNEPQDRAPEAETVAPEITSAGTETTIEPAAPPPIENYFAENTGAGLAETAAVTNEWPVPETEIQEAHAATVETTEHFIDETPAAFIETTTTANTEGATEDNTIFNESGVAAGFDNPATSLVHENTSYETPAPVASSVEYNQENHTTQHQPDEIIYVTPAPEETVAAIEQPQPVEPVIEPAAPAAFTSEENTGKPLLRIIETSAAKDDMLFEPYHTVDYFASQGIKLSNTEAEAKDKLGSKLKSFTDWLKTMKKLPQTSINNILAKNEESKVVEDAIHSIENKEVITEAMAEVFEKQGMAEKAAEVYRKLSLLNPAKSAYFAAKIEDLKH